MKTFFSLSALSALVRVPFEGWFKPYRTRMNAEAAEKTLKSLSALSALAGVPQYFLHPLPDPSLRRCREWADSRNGCRSAAGKVPGLRGGRAYLVGRGAVG
jgi:hypothetical protein